MKTKPPTKPLNLAKPADIVDDALREALRPFAGELRQAASIDAELEAEMNRTHPTAVKKECDELFERACNGDKEADGILRAAGGTEAYVKARTAMFDLVRGKREAKCKADAPLWQKVSDAAVAALDRSLVAIEAQWSELIELHGEVPVPSSWRERIAQMQRAISRAPFAAAELNHGTAWQLTSLNLSGAIK
jgi:hypothetical protein